MVYLQLSRISADVLPLDSLFCSGGSLCQPRPFPPEFREIIGILSAHLLKDSNPSGYDQVER